MHVLARQVEARTEEAVFMNTIDHVHVEANGVQFHVAVSGPVDGSPILCLHGFPEGWMSWRKVMTSLGEVRMYAPDMRGYPNTKGGGGAYDVFTLTEDVRAL